MPAAREPRVPALYDRAARVLLALPFLADGIVRLARPARSAEVLAGYGLVFPEAANLAIAALELVAGALLVLGLAVYAAALVLAVSILPATFMSRGLLAVEHPSALLDMARDLALSGGLLLLAGLHRRDRGARSPDVAGEASVP